MSSSYITFGRIFPNFVTLIGLFSGLVSIRCSFMGRWEQALIFIIVACFIDGLDGKIARMMRATSDFGAQLDSLADFLNFGIAPSILMYFWYFGNSEFFGWSLMMLFVACMALRLARFNASIGKEDGQGLTKRFFRGVAAPVGAILFLMPLMLSLNSNLVYGITLFDDVGISVHVLLISFLVISRIPTFSLKQINVPGKFSSVFMLLLILLIVCAITHPWTTFPVMAVFYVLSMPISSFVYYKKVKCSSVT